MDFLIGWWQLDHSWTTVGQHVLICFVCILRDWWISLGDHEAYMALESTMEDTPKTRIKTGVLPYDPMTPIKLRSQDTTSLWPRSLAHSSGIFPTPRRFSNWPAVWILGLFISVSHRPSRCPILMHTHIHMAHNFVDALIMWEAQAEKDATWNPITNPFSPSLGILFSLLFSTKTLPTNQRKSIPLTPNRCSLQGAVECASFATVLQQQFHQLSRSKRIGQRSDFERGWHMGGSINAGGAQKLDGL